MVEQIYNIGADIANILVKVVIVEIILLAFIAVTGLLILGARYVYCVVWPETVYRIRMHRGKADQKGAILVPYDKKLGHLSMYEIYSAVVRGMIYSAPDPSRAELMDKLARGEFNTNDIATIMPGYPQVVSQNILVEIYKLAEKDPDKWPEQIQQTAGTAAQTVVPPAQTQG